MPRQQYSYTVQDKIDHDMHNDRGFSVSTREKLTPYLTIPPQSSIKIQGMTQDKQIEMFARGFEILNDVGNQGVDVEISLYQECTSDTNDSNVTDFSLSNTGESGSLLIHTNPQNVVIGVYRGDLSSSLLTVNKEVQKGVDSESEYLMPLNDKSIIEIENFNTVDALKIALYWRYIERWWNG